MSPEWVLSAAHCVDLDVTGRSIQYGSTKISSEGPTIVEIEKIIIHEDYVYIPSPFYIINDIALLKLKSPIDMGEIENTVKLAMPTLYFPTGVPTIVAGWGRNATGGAVQEILQKSTLQIFSANDCMRKYEETGIQVHFTNICAGIVGGGKGSCNGDSGGLSND